MSWAIVSHKLLLHDRFAAFGGATNRSAFGQWPASGGNSQAMEFLANRAVLFEAVGITPQRDGCLGRYVGKHAVKSRRLMERFRSSFTPA